jgi:hypothetical protein
MADIKNIDADVLTQSIRHAAEEAKSEIDRLAARAIADVEQTSRALTSLPTTTSDLIATADVVLVREFSEGELNPYGHDRQINVVLATDGNNHYPMCEWDRRPNVRNGRYRAIFVLLPLGPKK